MEEYDKVDQLAKKGLEWKRKERYLYILITYIKRGVQEMAMVTWKKRWPLMNRGESYHQRPS
jgi:hypothetical protein